MKNCFFLLQHVDYEKFSNIPSYKVKLTHKSVGGTFARYCTFLQTYIGDLPIYTNCMYNNWPTKATLFINSLLRFQLNLEA